MDKYIFELIDIVQKGNKDKVINLLIIFQNQIKSYSKKAHSEDIEQDLYVFLIHLIFSFVPIPPIFFCQLIIKIRTPIKTKITPPNIPARDRKSVV